MISKRVDVLWVSKTLGHKDASITLKVYAKFIEEDDDKRLKNIAEIDKKMVKLENSNDKNSDK
jgi:integrase